MVIGNFTGGIVDHHRDANFQASDYRCLVSPRPSPFESNGFETGDKREDIEEWSVFILRWISFTDATLLIFNRFRSIILLRFLLSPRSLGVGEVCRTLCNCGI